MWLFILFNTFLALSGLLIYQSRRQCAIKARSADMMYLQLLLVLFVGNFSLGMTVPHSIEFMVSANGTLLCSGLHAAQSGFLYLLSSFYTWPCFSLFTSHYLMSKKYLNSGDEPPNLNVVQKVAVRLLRPSRTLSMKHTMHWSIIALAVIMIIVYTTSIVTMKPEIVGSEAWCGHSGFNVPAIHSALWIGWGLVLGALITGIRDLTGRAMELVCVALMQYAIGMFCFLHVVVWRPIPTYPVAQYWMMAMAIVLTCISLWVLLLFTYGSRRWVRNDVGSFASFKANLSSGALDETMRGCLMLDYGVFWKTYTTGCDRYGILIEYYNNRPCVSRSQPGPAVEEYSFSRRLIEKLIKDKSLGHLDIQMREHMHLLDLAPVFIHVTEELFTKCWPMYGLSLKLVPKDIATHYTSHRRRRNDPEWTLPEGLTIDTTVPVSPTSQVVYDVEATSPGFEIPQVTSPSELTSPISPMSATELLKEDDSPL